MASTQTSADDSVTQPAQEPAQLSVSLATNSAASAVIADAEQTPAAEVDSAAPSSGAVIPLATPSSGPSPGQKLIDSIFGTMFLSPIRAGELCPEPIVSKGYPQVANNVIYQYLVKALKDDSRGRNSGTLTSSISTDYNNLKKDALETKTDTVLTVSRWPRKSAYSGDLLRNKSFLTEDQVGEVKAFQGGLAGLSLANCVTRFNPFSREFENSVVNGSLGLKNPARREYWEEALSVNRIIGQNTPIALLPAIARTSSSDPELRRRVLTAPTSMVWSHLYYGQIVDQHPYLSGEVSTTRFHKNIAQLTNRERPFGYESHFLLNSSIWTSLYDFLKLFPKILAGNPMVRSNSEFEYSNSADYRQILPGLRGNIWRDVSPRLQIGNQVEVQLLNIFEVYDPICPSVCFSIGIKVGKSSRPGEAIAAYIHHYWVDLPLDMFFNDLQVKLHEEVNPGSAMRASKYVRNNSLLPSPSILNGNTARLAVLGADFAGVDLLGKQMPVSVGDMDLKLPLTENTSIGVALVRFGTGQDLGPSMYSTFFPDNKLASLKTFIEERAEQTSDGASKEEKVKLQEEKKRTLNTLTAMQDIGGQLSHLSPTFPGSPVSILFNGQLASPGDGSVALSYVRQAVFGISNGYFSDLVKEAKTSPLAKTEDPSQPTQVPYEVVAKILFKSELRDSILEGIQINHYVAKYYQEQAEKEVTNPPERLVDTSRLESPSSAPETTA